MAKTRSPIGNEDVNVFRCRRCGFPCDLSRDKISGGNGKVYSRMKKVLKDKFGNILKDSNGVTLTSSDNVDGPKTATVRFGCPQCGRGDFTDSKFFR